MNHKVPKEHQGLEDNFRIICFLCSKFFFISLITLLAACSQATVQSPVISPSPIPATSTSEPSPTPTTSPTSTPTATETPLPTATFTSTPTPTLALPVGLQTQLPPAAQAITAQNASQLRELANFGSPLLRKFTFTPDGKRGLVLTSTGVGIFDLQSGQLLGIHPPVNCYQPGYECNSFESYSITLNGERLASKLFNHVQVWDLIAGKILDIPLKIQNNQYNFYHFISISPDGQVLSFEDLEPAATKYWETRTYHYNITTGEEIQDLPDQGHFRGLLSPDGRWSAESGGNGAIAVWQVKDWSLIGQTNLDQGTQEAIAFSPGGDLLAVQDDQSLYIYRVSPWRLIRQFSARSYYRWFINLANSVSFSQTGELLAILEGYQYNRGQPYTLYIGVWSISTGEPISSQEFQDGIWGFSLSDEGEISQVQIPAQACLELGFPQASDCTQAPLYGRQIDVFPVGESLAIFQRDGEHYQVCRVKPGEAAGCAQPGEMSFLNLDGELYTIRRSSLSGSYEVYQEIAQSLSFLGSFQPANEDLSVRWLSVDKRLLLLTTGYADYTNSYIDQIELWDIQRKVLLRSWSGSYIPPEVSPDGNYLAVAANNKFILYDLRSNETIYSITDSRNLSTTPAFLNEYGGFAFTPDGRLVYPLISYQTNDQNLYNYDLIALELATRQTRSLVQLQLPLNELRAIAVSPDGSLLALGWPDGRVQIFDLQTGQELNHFQAHSANVTRLVFTPNGRYLASVAAGGGNGGDGFLRLWGIWP